MIGPMRATPQFVPFLMLTEYVLPLGTMVLRADASRFARETVQQKVLELQERKRELAASLFADGGGASVRDLTREDLEGLFA
jgi:hypothetical protein